MEKKDYSEIKDKWNQGYSLSQNYKKILESHTTKEEELASIRSELTTEQINWDKFDFLLVKAWEFGYNNYYKIDGTDRTRIRGLIEYQLNRDIQAGYIIASSDIDWGKFDTLFEKDNGHYYERMAVYQRFNRRLGNVKYLIRNNIEESCALLKFNINSKQINWTNFNNSYTTWGAICCQGYRGICEYQDILCMLNGNKDDSILLLRKESCENKIRGFIEDYLEVIGVIFNEQTIQSP